MIDSEVSKESVKFTPPSWRYDLDRPVDLIEEFAKHYGFNNFESTLPQGVHKNNKGSYWDLKSYLSSVLTSNNFQEVQTLSFVNNDKNFLFNPEKKYVEVFNAIDQSSKFMRSNLMSSLIDVYKLNYDQNNLSNSYFEINTVFDTSKNKIYEDVPNQNIVLGFLTSSTLSNTDTRLKDQELDLYYVKNILTQLLSSYDLEPITKPGFHQNYSFSIIKNGQIIGHFGQLASETQMTLEFNNEIYLGEIYINKLNLNNLKEINYVPLSQYPFVKFDLSFSVPIDLSAHLLVDEINELLTENENSIEIFDDFQQENSRNLGIRIITRSYEKTYDDNETREILMNISQTLESKFNITLNSSKND